MSGAAGTSPSHTALDSRRAGGLRSVGRLPIRRSLARSVPVFSLLGVLLIVLVLFVAVAMTAKLVLGK